MLIKDKVVLWRQLFYGRQEIFGQIEVTFSTTGDATTTCSPVYKDQNATTVSQKYLPLSDSHIESHIKGAKELLIYLLHEDNSIRFAAIDFDKVHTFADVLKCRNVITQTHGFPCYIARSRSKGYHLYMFFDAQIEACAAIAYIQHVYDLVGFMAEWAEEKRFLPETFPKTVQLRNELATGYGIRPPMQENGTCKDRNCWVDDEDAPIGGKGLSEEQWEYMSKIQRIGIDQLLTFLDKNDITIEKARLSEKRGLVPQLDYKRPLPYQAPEDGDLLRVINGCPAAKRLWYDTPRDNVPHDFHVAVLSWAMRTRNGLEVVREYWAGSSRPDLCEKQIQYALDTVQQPWTCRAMQEHGLCVKGKDPKFVSGDSSNTSGHLLADYCLKKSPPKEVIHGQLVTNPEKLPESDWRDPSPIRLRVKMKIANPEWVRKVINELDPADPNLADRVSELYQSILLIRDRKERDDLIRALKSRKLMKANALKEFEKEAKEAAIEEAKQEIEERPNTAILNDIVYTVLDQGGYATLTVDKHGNEQLNQFANFSIELEKNVRIHSILGEDLHELRGTLTCKGIKSEFKIPTADWSSNQKLAACITVCSSTHAHVDVKSLDRLRASVNLFGSHKMVTENFYEDYGYDDNLVPTLFRSKSWNITAEGYKGNMGNAVDLTHSGFAQGLGYEKLETEDFKKTLLLMKNNLLTMQDPVLTYTTVAHSLQASIHNAYIPMAHAPILWIQGLTGSGKSALAMFAQNMHGNFPRLLTVGSTSKSIEFYSMLFKDSLLVLDDFKEAFYREGVIKLIQTIYDKAARGRLRKDLTQAAAPFCRGLLMITSEDRPTAEASAMSRCLFLEAPHVTSFGPESDARFRALQMAQDRLCGVTGRFIHWMLNTHPTADEVASRFWEYQTLLKEPIADRQNSNRVASNCAANYVTWDLFCDFMRDSRIISSDEDSEYREVHWRNLQRVRDSISAACGVEQAGNLFISVLRELIYSGAGRLINLSTRGSETAPVLGFIDHSTPDDVYIHPSIAMGLIKKALRDRGSCFSHSQDSVANQLVQDGLISKVNAEGKATTRKQFEGFRGYVWCLDAEKCEIGNVFKKKKEFEEVDNNVLDLSNF